LFRSVYISRFFAGFLLIVFSFSITPKNYLHSLFAKHDDCRYEKRTDSQYQVTYAGYNCYPDNLVTESGFDNDLAVLSFPIFIAYSSYIIQDVSFTSVAGIFSSLRGPPVNI